jgi:hypothetical protein
MALSEKLEIQNNMVKPTCPYQIMLNNMNPVDKKALQKAWDEGYSQRVILRALRAEGYKTSNEAIQAHRVKQCRCLIK